MLDALRAEAGVLSGDTELAEVVVPRLLAYSQAADVRQSTVFKRQARRLTALVATARENHSDAAHCYADLAREVDHRPTQFAVLLQGCFHAGLESDPVLACMAARQLLVPSDLGVYRLMVAAALEAAARQYAAASETFAAAAEMALTSHNPYGALRAFRNAEWAARRGGLWNAASFGADAVKLEPIVAMRVVRLTTHERLMDRIDTLLARGDLGEAFITVHRCRMMAWIDADLAALEAVQLRLAAVWRATAIDTPREDIILDALRESVCARVLIPSSEAASTLSPFLAIVRERLTNDFTAKVWRAITGGGPTADITAGACLLALEIGSQWSAPTLHLDVGDLVMRGIASGSGGAATFNGTRAACELLLSLDPPLTGIAASQIRETLAALINRTAPSDLPIYLNALAVATADGKPPTDGGAGLAKLLLGLEPRAIACFALSQWIGAVAMLHRVSSEPTRSQLAQLLRARAAPGSSSLGWQATERAIAAGLVFDSGVAERYLEEMATLLDTLRAEAKNGKLGLGATDIPGLTRWAATTGSDASRDNALRAAVEFLVDDRPLLFERGRWIPFIAQLATHSQNGLATAVAGLSMAAQGGLRPVMGIDSSHPLDRFRVVGSSPNDVRSYAVAWLASLAPVARRQEWKSILTVLAAAVSDDRPTVREAAIRGVGWALQNSQCSAERRRILKRTVLVPLTDDISAGVALAAYRARDN